MNTYLQEILKKNEFVDKNGKTVAVKYQIPNDEGEQMASLIKSIGAEKAIEIGTAYGISSIYIAEALKKTANTKFISIDPFQAGFNDYGIYNVEQAGFKDIFTHYKEPSHFVLPRLAEKGEKFDFIFIDGDHLYDFAFVDFFYSDLLLNVGGIMLIDDTGWRSVRKVVDYVATNRAYEVVFPEKRDVTKISWKRNLLMQIPAISNSAMLDERLRYMDEYKPAYELPDKTRYVAFKKLAEDSSYRTDQQFHKVF